MGGRREISVPVFVCSGDAFHVSPDACNRLALFVRLFHPPYRATGLILSVGNWNRLITLLHRTQ